MRWAMHVVSMGKITEGCKVLAGENLKEENFKRPKRAWDDNIKVDLQEDVC
jgi:hypothetical protein